MMVLVLSFSVRDFICRQLCLFITFYFPCAKSILFFPLRLSLSLSFSQRFQFQCVSFSVIYLLSSYMIFQAVYYCIFVFSIYFTTMLISLCLFGIESLSFLCTSLSLSLSLCFSLLFSVCTLKISLHNVEMFVQQDQ